MEISILFGLKKAKYNMYVINKAVQKICCVNDVLFMRKRIYAEWRMKKPLSSRL